MHLHQVCYCKIYCRKKLHTHKYCTGEYKMTTAPCRLPNGTRATSQRAGYFTLHIIYVLVKMYALHYLAQQWTTEHLQKAVTIWAQVPLLVQWVNQTSSTQTLHDLNYTLFGRFFSFLNSILQYLYRRSRVKTWQLRGATTVMLLYTFSQCKEWSRSLCCQPEH